MTRSDLPSGTVTFLFTDVEGSTKLLDELGEARYSQALSEHRSKLRGTLGRHGGVEVDTQGDAFFYVFTDPRAAVAAVTDAQDALTGGAVKVRMGLHTGPSVLTDEGYVGREIHRGARIAAAGHGGQVLLSNETRKLVEVDVVDLGEHRLKDFAEPVWLFQLGPERFPPLKTISNTNLPRPASAFVGRVQEIEDVLKLLRDGTRLLTLTGPGGSGKTRLAIEAAAELVSKVMAGVFWVGLAALRDPALVLATIAQTLGAKKDLAEHIGERGLLLLLDNLEQVVEAAPEIAALVERCPNLIVLVTSRERLRVRGEVEYPVKPMAEQEAVELFCERAHVRPDATIAELCFRLDSLPLAVELAAARMSVLSAAQILERLAQRLDLFQGGRDAEARQKTLRATIAWSHELLNSEEKALFARLAVFAGGCSLEAAAAVCGAHLDTLQSLVDKNLIRRTRDRFEMLETIREYAAETLDRLGETDALRSRLARYLVEAVNAQGAPMFLGRQPDAYARFEREHANTRVVMDWALQEHRPEFTCELIASLFIFWSGRGHLIEARQWVEAALATRREVPEELSIRMLVGASEIFRAGGDFATAAALKEELLERYAACEPSDPLLIPANLVNLSEIAMEAGDFKRARELAEESLRLRVARGLNPARALISLGQLALLEGDLIRAEGLLEDAVRGFAALQDESNEASALGALGEVARRRGDDRRAIRLFTEALRRAVALGHKPVVGDCLLDLAVMAMARGDVGRAARLWGAGQEIHKLDGSIAARAREMNDLPESLQAEGAAMSLEEAVTYALGSQEQVQIPPVPGSGSSRGVVP